MTKYGGFWIRFVAALIDGILISIAMAFMPLEGHASGFISILAGWIYAAALESSAHQATLGKMALGLKVTDLKGKRITFLRATGRHFAKYLSAAILCIGFLMIAFTKKKQGLHDILAETLVVKK